VLAIKRSDGSVLWRRTVTEEPPQSATHADGSWACGSAVTDGQRVYAYFGSYGLYVLDMDGNPKWAKRLGVFKMKANFGEGVSPTLAGDELIVNQDQEGPSFIAAFDTATGAEKWRVAREETTSWATPLVVEFDGRRQIITSATSRIRSYDAATGELLWQAAGMTGNVIPSPVAGGGIVYCASGFRGSSLMAIRLAAARGDITGKPDALAWSVRKDTPYVPSPLLYGGLLYYTRVNSGALTCVEAATGKVQYGPQAMDELKGLYCSPVAAAGRVYITGRKGLTVVLKAGPTFEVLARNPLDDQFTASAALVGRQIFLRGYRSLYCIAAGQK
jgi:outer membrane protein assembly factor BamB